MTQPTLDHPVVIIGLGEIGSVIARGCLRLGQAVVPVLRDTDISALAARIPEPAMVVIATGENDLHAAIDRVPKSWREGIVLIQNELLPRDWREHGLDAPTVMSVWFEKKPGMDSKVVVPSVAYGPRAELLQQALATLDLPVTLLDSEEQLIFELVRKNLYILTTNIAGLKTGGNVTQLWRDHRQLAEAVAREVLKLQAHLTGATLEEDRLIEAMVEAFEGDPEHGCMGRSAPQRLERALSIARSANIDVPVMEKISRDRDLSKYTSRD